MKWFSRISLALVLLFALGTLPGCGGKSVEPSPEPRPIPTVTPTPEPTTPVTPPASTTETSSVLLYFTRGEKLGVAGREVRAEDSAEGRAEAAMKALLGGPTARDKAYGLGTTIPEGTTLNGVTIEGDTATVDLSRAYESGGGSLSMLLRVSQVVYTLTQFEGVNKVAFELDGTIANSIGGEGIIVSPSVTRANFEGQAPAILVESPVPGQSVTSPVHVGGSANVFEAQFRAKVVDPSGKTLTDQAIKATSGTGTRGTFSANIPFSPTRAGLGSIVFYEPSAKDGSPINVVKIPVRMTK